MHTNKAQIVTDVGDDVRINTVSIPTYAAEALAAATLDFILQIKRQPGGQEMLDARTAIRKARQAAKNAEL
jgi:hypothetical protein